ncbi:MAG: serine/threonine protein kinase [Deltaproteobacteria bacterium]|nr:serine/threonine protein kinase [Deltaproteobacteria bacterium]
MAARSKTQTRFGKYRLLRRLARGGMAEIFLARYEAAAGISKVVVVKKILPAFADNPRFLKMFIDEARVTVGLSHGNIAQVFDFGEIDGSYYLAMEYVQGQALSSVLTRTTEAGLAFPIPIACFVTMEVCKGLGYAHRKCDETGKPLGIVHRDVSPQNVMISYEGQVKVVDFGIAKAANLAGDTRAGALKGKYLYFAPEQARSRPIDARTDVCATGIVLYELLTGRRPYSGVLMDVLESILKGHFPKPRALEPEIPPSLERIVLKAMAVSPDDRYQSAAEMQEAIGAFLFKAAPRFTSSSVAHFVRYLYQPEIEATGQAVELPESFLEQVPLWERRHHRSTPTSPGSAGSGESALPGTAEERGRLESGDTGVDTAGTDSGSFASADLIHPSTAEAPLPRPRRPLPRPVIWGGLGALLAVIFAAAGLTAASSMKRVPGVGVLAIESEPPGARIFLDGEDTGQETPYVFQGLAPGQQYGLTLRLAGHQPRMASVTASTTGSTTVTYDLAPERQPVAPVVTATDEELDEAIRQAAEKEAQTNISGLAGALGDLAAEMGQTGKKLDPTPQRVTVRTLDVRKLGGISRGLDPKQRNTLSMTGAAFLADPMVTAATTQAYYVVERLRGDASLDRGVLSSAEPIQIPAGAHRVHFLFADDNIDDDSGQLIVRIQPDRGRFREVTLDPRRHSFSPAKLGLPYLQHLKVTERYEIYLGDQPPCLYSRGPMLKTWSGLSTPEPAIGVFEDGALMRGGVDLRIFDLAAGRRPNRTLVVKATHSR